MITAFFPAFFYCSSIRDALNWLMFCFFFGQKQSIVVSKKQEESHPSQESVEEYIVRSPPAGTKESPDYVPSLDLQETKLLFEQSPSGNRRSSQQSSRC